MNNNLQKLIVLTFCLTWVPNELGDTDVVMSRKMYENKCSIHHGYFTNPSDITAGYSAITYNSTGMCVDPSCITSVLQAFIEKDSTRPLGCT